MSEYTRPSYTGKYSEKESSKLPDMGDEYFVIFRTVLSLF